MKFTALVEHKLSIALPILSQGTATQVAQLFKRKILEPADFVYFEPEALRSFAALLKSRAAENPSHMISEAFFRTIRTNFQLGLNLGY